MTPTQIELLKRAWKTTGEILLSDDMARRIQEIGAIHNLRWAGYVETLEPGKRPPGPPEPPRYVITDVGREALQQETSK